MVSRQTRDASKWKRAIFVDTFCPPRTALCVQYFGRFSTTPASGPWGLGKVGAPQLLILPAFLTGCASQGNLICLEAVLLGVMAEGAVSDFEKLGSPRADAAGLFQGGLQVQSLRGGYHLFKIYTFVRYFDPLVHSPAGGGAAITQDAIRQHAHGNLFASF